ncbi:MAG: AAA family ATPase [Armatimonadetes bacterium]|nr:AAA family ATPase [Armatimonadota bacterium]
MKIDWLPKAFDTEPKPQLSLQYPPSEGIIEPDDPIQSDSNDHFNRGSFATYLATVINDLPKSQRENQAGIVIALFGEWGTGKTSVKNLALKSERIEVVPTVVEFNPWQFDSQESLIREFFSALAHGAFGTNDSYDSMEKRAKVMGYAARIASISSITVGAFVPLGDKVLGEVSKGFGRLEKVLEAGSEGLAERAAKDSLTTLRNDLAKDLQELEKPILVILDDIDRLEHAEVRLLMQLLKANANLPNVHFLLLASRQQLVNALSHDGNEGTEYVQKIVTASVDLPIEDKKASRSYLETRLRELGVLYGEEIRVDDAPIQWWLDSVFPDLIKTPRAAKRFVNGLRLYLGCVSDETNNLHANFDDLVAVEIIRQFFPSQYSRIIEEGLNLTTNLSDYFDMVTEGYPTTSRFDYIRSLTNHIEGVERKEDENSDEEVFRPSVAIYPHSDTFIQVCTSLFPFLNWQKGEFVNVESDDLLAAKRLCHPSYWPIYFQMAPAKAPLDENSFNEYLSSDMLATDFEKFARSFSRDGISQAMQFIRIRWQDVEDDKRIACLVGIVEIEDQSANASFNSWDRISYGNIVDLLTKALGTILEDGERVSFWESLLSGISSNRSLLRFTNEVEGILPASKKQFIKAHDIDMFRSSIEKRLGDAWSKGSLLKSPGSVESILYLQKKDFDFGPKLDLQKAKDWIDAIIQDSHVHEFRLRSKRVEPLDNLTFELIDIDLLDEIQRDDSSYMGKIEEVRQIFERVEKTNQSSKK